MRQKSLYISHPQTKLLKDNVFTSVCQEFCPQWGEVYTPRADPPQGRHPLPDNPPGQTPPRQTPPPGRHPRPRDGHCSGWYASNWNVFLFSTKNSEASEEPRPLSPLRCVP